MKILILGRNGQLGRELVRAFAGTDELTALGRTELDITDIEKVRTVVRSLCPDIIINATAYTAVDEAEEQPELAMQINRDAPRALAEEAHKYRALFIHYSTDFVFDGASTKPYGETDEPHPLNIYGQSKLEGENAIREVSNNYLIIRTGWIYSLETDNFLTRVLKWARTQKEMFVVNDQVGGPTSARLLANVTRKILAGTEESTYKHFKKYGLYHLAPLGGVSRYEWAKKILLLDPLSHEHIVQNINAVPSDHFATLARRPVYSVLDCSLIQNTFNLVLPSWEAELHTVMLG